MASQYQKMKVNYDKYMSQPFVDPEVVREMERQLSYANTWDPEVGKQASDILRGSN